MTSKERFPTYSFVFMMTFYSRLTAPSRLFPTIGFQIITENKFH